MSPDGPRRARRHPADDWTSDAIAVDCFECVPDDREPTRLQLVDVPEIAAAAMLPEPKHEQVVAAAVDPCARVALGQQPDVAAIILRPVILEQRDLKVAWRSLLQLTRECSVISRCRTNVQQVAS